jgi:hypothetical protein
MFRVLPPFGSDQRGVAEVVNGIMNGKTNNTGSVTLATGGATTTTITDARIGVDSVILLSPTTNISSTNYFPYGAFQDSTDQSAVSTTTAYAVKYNTTDYAEGVTLSNNSRLNVTYSGLYNLQFSLQFANSDVQIQDVDVWFRKNGTDLPGSNSKFSVPNSHGGTNGHLIAALNYFLAMAKNDYVEIMWATTSTSVTIEQLPTQTSPTRPATPSAIVTLGYLSSNGYTTDIFVNPYISSVTNGSAVITHPANSVAGKTFDYVVIG